MREARPVNAADLQDLVLVVDDDLAVRDALKFALELDGLSVDTCGSGAELLRHPGLGRARCLVLDYQMPDMNGFAVMGELKRRNVALPVILITAPLSREVERRAAAAGVAGVLEKPLLEDTLIEKIRHVL
jgi:two-component system, LuxR family, response regulator FixJ